MGVHNFSAASVFLRLLHPSLTTILYLRCDFGGDDYRITSTAFGRGNGCTSYQTETSDGVCFRNLNRFSASIARVVFDDLTVLLDYLRILVRLLVSDLKGIYGSAPFRVDSSKALNRFPELSNPREPFKFDAAPDYDLVTTNVESIMWADGGVAARHRSGTCCV